MFRNYITYFRDVGTILSNLNIFTGIKHGYPVLGGDDERVGMVVGNIFDLRFVSFNKQF